MYAGIGLGSAVFQTGINAMSAGNGVISLLVKVDVVLPEMDTLCAFEILQKITSNIILEFIHL